MEVDYGYKQVDYQEDEEEYQLKHAISQKKRTYRLEIRKKKLQQVFDKSRKLNFGGQFQGSISNDQQQKERQKYVEKNANEMVDLEGNDQIESLYDQNQQQIREYQKQSNLNEQQDQILLLVNELNKLIYNFDVANMAMLERVLLTILKDYLIAELNQPVLNTFKDLFFHNSLHLIIKNPDVTTPIKNSALWCLINITHEKEDQYNIIGKLVDQDIITTLKMLIKEKKNVMLYENIIWLSNHISLDSVEYRCRLLEEGFIFSVGNYIKYVTECINNKEETLLDSSCIKVMLNLCTAMMSVHHKMEDLQFRIIGQILLLGLQINQQGFFELIIEGTKYLFQEENLISESKFNMLYEIRFFSQFFMNCVQNEVDTLGIAQIYKQISLLDFTYIKLLLKQEMILPLYMLLSHPLMKVREDIAFTLSNLFMNGDKFIHVASSYTLDTKILSLLEERESIDVQKEAVWALSNLLQYQNIEQKEEFLSNKEVIRILCEFFNKNYEQLNDEIAAKMLDCFQQILEFGEYSTRNDDSYESNPYWIAIEVYQTASILELLSQERNKNNSLQASEMLEKYSWCRSNNQNQ